MRACATTACFPGFSVRAALARIADGISEPLLGELGSAFVQLCPQNMGRITEQEAEALRADFAGMRLRTHANARVDPAGHRLLDLSTVTEHTLPYYRLLGDRNRRLGAACTSLHAGYREHCETLQQMLDHRQRLQDEVFGEIVLAVEGLYPNRRRPQVLDSWAEYEALLRSGAPFALDLSHLQIVAAAERCEHHDLVRELIGSRSCMEIHLSDNDSRSDAHLTLSVAPWWWEDLVTTPVQPGCVIFSEGNQLGRGRSRVPVRAANEETA